jgi:hypothetical protein
MRITTAKSNSIQTLASNSDLALRSFLRRKRKTNMVKLTRTVPLLASILLSSCAISKALYLGEDIYSGRSGPQSVNAKTNAEDINGFFPEAVYIKTRTQTFNTYHYYILNDGLIWHKNINTDTGIPPDFSRNYIGPERGAGTPGGGFE